MTDLLALTAEELGEAVTPSWRLRPNLSELVRRASERDQAVRERNEAQHAYEVLDGIREQWAQEVERADRLAAALAFYADPNTYEEGTPEPGAFDGPIPIKDDGGQRARDALAASGAQDD